MLDELLRWSRVRLCGQAIPVGPELERYATYLIARGYSAYTWKQYVNAVDRFRRWLGRRALSRVAVQRFLIRRSPAGQRRLPTIRRRNFHRAALNHLLEMYGVAEIRADSPGFTTELLRRYEEQMVTVQGLAAGTVHMRLALARTMLNRLKVRRANQLRTWTPQLIERYVSGQGRRFQPSTGKNIACGARSLLRFLLQEELISSDLAAAVPAFAHWRLAPLPQTLQEEELARLINAADVRTAIGLRDRAMLLCMSELGLRASDVASLEVKGVDIPTRVLRLRRCKERESTVLPMTGRLADAMQAYLRRGRPACATQSLFVRHHAPIGKSISPISISNMVVRLAGRVGLRDRIGGAHVLRHSMASRMLGAGASLKQVADLLGHQSIDTTAIYAKVDLGALSQVALPWPGAKGVQQ
jgi:integrase/recombinase XerD